MRFEFFSLSLLSALEQYVPFMSEGEIREVLYYGKEPDAQTVWRWEVRKAERERAVGRRFADAWERQK